MKPGDLVICLKNYLDAVEAGVVFIPFIPKKDDICTIKSIISTEDGPGYELEEVAAKFMGYQKPLFEPKYWRKLDTISLDEVTELSKEAQENYSLVELTPNTY